LDFWLDLYYEYKDTFLIVLKCLGAFYLFIGIQYLYNLFLGRLTEQNKTIVVKIINFIRSVLVVVIGMWIYFYMFKNPYDEYLLITNCSKANGYLTSVELKSEEVTDGVYDQRSGIHYFFDFNYNFKLPSGNVVTYEGTIDCDKNSSSFFGEDEERDIIVEYVLNNPQINRIIGLNDKNRTIWDWFWFNLIVALIVLSILIHVSYKMYLLG